MTFPLVCSLFLSPFFPLFCFFLSLLCIFDGPLSCRFVSVTGVVLGISKLVEKVDDRLGKKRTRKYSSRNDLCGWSQEWPGDTLFLQGV